MDTPTNSGNQFRYHYFNRLPEPDWQALPQASLKELDEAFPYLFKANSALALHARNGQNSSFDLGWPSKQGDGFRLIGISLRNIPDVPPCVAVLDWNGQISFWCHDRFGGGLQAVQLKENSAANAVVRSHDIEVNTLSPTNFITGQSSNVTRCVQSTDEDCLHTLRLESSRQSITILLDFSTFQSAQDVLPITVSTEINNRLTSQKTDAVQIGGWEAGLAIHRNIANNHIFLGSPVRPRKPAAAPPSPLTELPLRCAAESKGMVVMGGGSAQIVVSDNLGEDWQATSSQLTDQAHVRCLGIIDRSAFSESQGGSSKGIHGLASSLILAGCDDRCLYVLGHQQNSADGDTAVAWARVGEIYLGGILQGVHVLGVDGDHADLALLVRGRGLLCARLRFAGLATALGVQRQRRQIYIERLAELDTQPLSQRIVEWLASDQTNAHLRAITLQLPYLIPNTSPSITIDVGGVLRQAPFNHFNDHVINYLFICLVRGIEKVFKSGRSPNNTQLQAYLQIIDAMEKGSYYARQQRFNLLVRIAALPWQQCTERSRNMLERLRQATPHAGLEYHACYEQLSKQSPGNQQRISRQQRTTLGRLLGLKEQFLHEGMFTLTATRPSDHRTRAVTIMDGDNGSSLFISAPRNSTTLHCFKLGQQAPFAEPETSRWNHVLRPTDSIRALLPLAAGQLLIVAKHDIGIAMQREKHIRWFDLKTSMSIWSAAIHPLTEGGQRLAIGYECRLPQQANEAGSIVQLYTLDARGQLSVDERLTIEPNGWGIRRLQIRALAWDDTGGLWASTDGDGQVWHWSRAQLRSRLSASPRVVARAQCTQYCLAVSSTPVSAKGAAPMVIIGGLDGVVRAYAADGGLCWSFATGGAIRGIANIAFADQKQRLVVISETEHVFCLNLKGETKSMLHLPGIVPLGLAAAGKVGARGRQTRLLIGSMHGHVHALESVPEGWNGEDFFSSGKNRADTHAEIDPQVSEWTQYASKNHDLQRQWLLLDAAIKEPLRAAWAACSLLSSGQAAKPVLDLLKSLHPRADSSLPPAVKRLTPLVLGAIGRFVNGIDPADKDFLVKTSGQIRDGSMASLIARLNGLSTSEPDSLQALFYKEALQKAKNNRPYTATAILQGLNEENLPLAMQALAVVRLQGRYSSFAEGVLARLLSLSGIENGRLLEQSSQFQGRPWNDALIGHDIDADQQMQLLSQLLDIHASKVLSPDNCRTWQYYGPTLSADAPPLSPKILQALINRLQDSNQRSRENCGLVSNTNDLRLLQSLRGMLPDALDLKQAAGLQNSPPDWLRPLFECGQTLQKMKTRMDLSVLSAPDLDDLINAQSRRLTALSVPKTLLSTYLKMFIEVWLDELNRLKKQYLPQDLADFPRVEADPVVFSPSIPVLLRLHLRNHGHQDISGDIEFRCDAIRGAFIEATSPQAVSTQRLRRAETSQEAEPLTLEVMLLPGIEKQLQIDVSWRIDQQRRETQLIVKPKPQWIEYTEKYANRHQMAVALFSKRDAERFRYQRIVIRCWTQLGVKLNQSELKALIEHWAKLAGRHADLQVHANNPAWSNARRIQAETWADQLLESPGPLDVWVIDEDIPWDLAFLTTLDKATASALLIPQLVVDDRPSSRFEIRELLDELLGPPDVHHMAVLQWALKAVCQSTMLAPKDQASQLPPTILAHDVQHSTDTRYKRGEVPVEGAWRNSRFASWPICGVESLAHLGLLPADATQPLGAVIQLPVFEWLYKMGLVRRWGRWWVPLASSLLNYIDTNFPSRALGRFPQDTDTEEGWRWDLSGWREAHVENARQLLFARRSQAPDFPPYQALDNQDIDRLNTHRKQHPIPEMFYALMQMELSNFDELLHTQRTWQSIISDQYPTLRNLQQRLKDSGGNITARTVSVGDRRVDLVQIELPGRMEKLHRLLLIRPARSWYQTLPEASERQHVQDSKFAVTNLIAEVEAQLDEAWLGAYRLLFFNVELLPDDTAFRAEYRVVLIGPRQLNRLLSAKSTTTAMLQIIQEQQRLLQFAQDVFTTQGPVQPEGFFGRKDDVNTLVQGLEANKSYVITGPRSIGKSSLLGFLPYSSHWKKFKMNERLVPITLDLQEQRSGIDYRTFFQQFYKGWTRAGITLSNKLGRICQDWLPDAEDFATEALQAKHLLGDVFGELVDQCLPRKPLLLIDEADGFYRQDLRFKEPLFAKFRAMHNAGQACFVFASYPPQARSMAKDIQDARNQSFNFLHLIELGPLSTTEGIELVQTSMKKIGIELSDPQAQALTTQSFAIPRVLQRVCEELLLDLDKQLAAGGGHYLGEDLILRAVRRVYTWVFGEFIAQITTGLKEHQLEQQHTVRTLRSAMWSLINDRILEFDHNDFIKRYEHESSERLSIKDAEHLLAPLLDTLILEKSAGLYRFSGPVDRPYFPTIIRDMPGGMTGFEQQVINEI